MSDKKIPGVGWTLQPGARTWRGGTIFTRQHPTGSLSYAESLGQVSISDLLRRWPEYSQGYDHTPSEQNEILSAVARAGRIPRMGNPDLYTLVPTAEQIIDFAALDRDHPDRLAILQAWRELSPRPGLKPDPGPAAPATAPVPPSSSPGLRPLSPAAVRAEELREMATTAWVLIPGGRWAWFPDLMVRSAWLELKPFAVEVLRFYRLLRRHLGDTRPLPQEDRS